MTDEPTGHLLVVGIAVGMLAFAALATLLMSALRDCRDLVIETLTDEESSSNHRLTGDEKAGMPAHTTNVGSFGEKTAILEKNG